MRTHALLLAVTLAVPSLAQVPEVSVPPPPPAVSAPSLPPAFFDRFVQVDFGGQTFVGREKKPLSRLELFNLTGRTDLVQQAESNRSRRLWYTVSAVTVGVLTLGGAAGLYFSGADLTGQACQNSMDVYNRCVANAKAHQIAAITTLLGGGVVTGILATLAIWADPDVLNRDETVELVSKYNAQLARSLKQTGLKLTPVVGPGQVGLVAQGSFP